MDPYKRQFVFVYSDNSISIFTAQDLAAVGNAIDMADTIPFGFKVFTPIDGQLVEVHQGPVSWSQPDDDKSTAYGSSTLTANGVEVGTVAHSDH